MHSTADFPTARAASLMQTMAKHFGHKIQTEITDTSASMHFDGGNAFAQVTPEGLHLRVEAADAETTAGLADVIGRHLLRFAQRDNPEPLVWSTPA